MTTLKSKIKIIPSLPTTYKKKLTTSQIVTFFLTLIILCVIGFVVYNIVLPYINAVDIKKVAGKKISYTDCNTKDYIIIHTSKAFSMQLTNENCEKVNYEGNIVIKNNEIIFYYKDQIKKKKNIKGTIDTSNYNIKVNNQIFESENND